MAADSRLFVFSDAARTPKRLPAVELVRDYIRTIGGFSAVTVIEQSWNLGLAESIIDGVTDLTKEFGRVIVIEDDLVVSPFFLQFMNDGLNVYADDERVASVQGYMFPVGKSLPETFFLKDPGCWGWGTWERAWRLFEKDGSRLRREINQRGLKHAFDYDGHYDYSGMLDDQIKGRNSSWAVRWYASVFLENRLTLHPGRSLVQNIGKDGSGTHDGTTDLFDVSLSSEPIRVNTIPVEESAIARDAMIGYLSSIRGAGFEAAIKRIIYRLRSSIARGLLG